MARKLKGKALPETPEQRDARIKAQKEAEKLVPALCAGIAAIVSILVYALVWFSRPEQADLRASIPKRKRY